jgi:hypothetical protein
VAKLVVIPNPVHRLNEPRRQECNIEALADYVLLIFRKKIE